MKTIPNYHPPQDYRRPTKTQEKVYVPVNDYPEINFSMITNPLTSDNPPLFPLLVFLLGMTSHSAAHMCLTGRSCRTLTRTLLFNLDLILTLSFLLAKLAYLSDPVVTR